MRPEHGQLRRHLHPGAWWMWAIGVALAASRTTNPLLLGLALAVVSLVVAARRDATPWGRAFRFYLLLGGFIVLVRVVLHVIVGIKFGEIVALPLPQLRLPDWAAGLQIGGTVFLEGLLGAALEGARLAMIIVAIGAANALASPKRLLKVLPAALHEIGSALVVAVAVAPQLAASAQRVLRARRLRGDVSRGLRGAGQLALPVLQDTLDRSLLLAAAMDSRGYGRRAPASARARLMPALTLTGLLAVCIGTYGVLDTGAPAVLGVPVLVLGLLAGAAGLWVRSRNSGPSRYRPDPWRWPEWLTLATGFAAATTMLVTARETPGALGMPLVPALAWPILPLLPVLGFLVAALPAILTPPPPLAPLARGRA